MQNEVNEENVNNQTNNNSVENSPVINNTENVTQNTETNTNQAPSMSLDELMRAPAGSVNTQQTTNGKSSGNKVVPIILAVILVAIVGCSTYYYINFIKNPTNGFISVINKAYEDFHSTITENEVLDFDIQNDAIEMNGTLKVNGSLMSLDTLESDVLDFNLGMDYKNNQIIMGAALNEDNKELIDATLYYQDKITYIGSNTLFSNIYVTDETEDLFESFDLEEYEELLKNNNTSLDDLDETVRMLKDALINSLDENNMIITSGDIELHNGKSVKVKETSYELNKDTIKNLLSTYADAIMNNDELMEDLANYSSLTKEVIKENLESLKEDEYYEGFTETGYINIYTTGLSYDFVKLEFITKEVEVTLEDYDDYLYINVNDTLDDSNITITGNTVDEVTDVKVSFNDELYATLKIRELSSNKIDLDFSTELVGTTISGTIYISNNVKDSSNSSYTIKLSLDLSTYDAALELNGKVKISNSLDFAETDSAININYMTAEDQIKYANTMANFQSSKIYTFISSLFSSTDDEYDYY